ncbi:uncharacterized protein [Antedon mediterranea]|uniref:uncharacterized protein n=1 Tax=Antedon mediterranea TaxID=105859 RepID=UPI003AF68B39
MTSNPCEDCDIPEENIEGGATRLQQERNSISRIEDQEKHDIPGLQNGNPNDKYFETSGLQNDDFNETIVKENNVGVVSASQEYDCNNKAISDDVIPNIKIDTQQDHPQVTDLHEDASDNIATQQSREKPEDVTALPEGTSDQLKNPAETEQDVTTLLKENPDSDNVGIEPAITNIVTGYDTSDLNKEPEKTIDDTNNIQTSIPSNDIQESMVGVKDMQATTEGTSSNHHTCQEGVTTNDIPDGLKEIYDNEAKEISHGASSLQDVTQKDIPDDLKDTNNRETFKREISHGATSLQEDPQKYNEGSVKEVSANGATSFQRQISHGATSPQEDPQKDNDGSVKEVSANGATSFQRQISQGATSFDGNYEGKPNQRGGATNQVNGVAEPPPTKVDRFGFTGGKQFEQNRDHNVPISVLRKRELKWLDMLLDWPKWMSKKQKKIKERCRKGIPSALRARAWQHLSGSKNIMEKNKLVFAELDAQKGDPKWVDQIEKDLDRQFPFHEMFAKGGGGQQDLFRILKAYSIYNPRDGYCQAQAPIAAVLVMQMPAEEAFWCLVQICEKYLVGYFSPGLEAMQIDGDVLLGLMKRHLTPIYHHMVEYNVEPVHYMTEWFMCIYSRTFPFASVLRVWDIFLCEGVKVLFKVALVIIKHTLSSKRQMEECQGFYETIQKLKNIPNNVVEDEFLINEVIEMRVFEKEFEAEHSLQVARRNAVKERQLRHSNQIEMAKQVALIKQKKKIKAKSKVQLQKPLSQSQGSLNYLSSDFQDSSSVSYSLPNTPGQKRIDERNLQKYSQSDSIAVRSKINGAHSQSVDELEFDEFPQTENGLYKKTEEKVKKGKKKEKKKKTRVK